MSYFGYVGIALIFKRRREIMLLAIPQQVRTEQILAHRSDFNLWILISFHDINPMASFA